MCGICGVYNYASGEPADERLLREMTETLRHRGRTTRATTSTDRWRSACGG